MDMMSVLGYVAGVYISAIIYFIVAHPKYFVSLMKKGLLVSSESTERRRQKAIRQLKDSLARQIEQIQRDIGHFTFQKARLQTLRNSDTNGINYILRNLHEQLDDLQQRLVALAMTESRTSLSDASTLMRHSVVTQVIRDDRSLMGSEETRILDSSLANEVDNQLLAGYTSSTLNGEGGFILKKEESPEPAADLDTLLEARLKKLGG